MGDFRIVIEAAGGHGCQREIGHGGVVYGCRSQLCPDCRIREFVEEMKMRYPVSKAELTHWPSDMAERQYPKEGEVKDDLLTRIRVGSFK